MVMVASVPRSHHDKLFIHRYGVISRDSGCQAGQQRIPVLDRTLCVVSVHKLLYQRAGDRTDGIELHVYERCVCGALPGGRSLHTTESGLMSFSHQKCSTLYVRGAD